MKWDERFLRMAELISTWSKDPSTRVGAVIFDQDNRVVSLGYNGFPKGVEDSADRYSDRATKYRMVVHAEMNAIMFAQRSLRGCSIATFPFMPCSNCAASIIQSGIARVVAPALPQHLAERWGESCRLSTEMFTEAGIELALYGS